MVFNLGNTVYPGDNVVNTTNPYKDAAQLYQGAQNQAMSLIQPAIDFKRWIAIREAEMQEAKLAEEKRRFDEQMALQKSRQPQMQQDSTSWGAGQQAQALEREALYSTPNARHGVSNPWAPGMGFAMGRAPQAMGYAPYGQQGYRGPQSSTYSGGGGGGAGGGGGKAEPTGLDAIYQDMEQSRIADANKIALDHAGDSPGVPKWW